MSMKSMPSSGRRLSVRIASAISSGGPQTRGPVMRIAPKPRRWISMSPPILNEPDLRASSFDHYPSFFCITKRDAIRAALSLSVALWPMLVEK